MIHSQGYILSKHIYYIESMVFIMIPVSNIASIIACLCLRTLQVRQPCIDHGIMPITKNLLFFIAYYYLHYCTMNHVRYIQ